VSTDVRDILTRFAAVEYKLWWILVWAALGPDLILRGAPIVPRLLTERRYHLGTPGRPEWQEFTGLTPHGSQLEVHFAAQTNENEATLFIRQNDVKQDWNVSLNGQRIGKLFLMENALTHALPLPPGALKAGENTLAITPTKEGDDIIVGEVKLDMRPLKEALSEAILDIEVTDPLIHAGLPCRITIVDHEGALAPLYPVSQPATPGSRPVSLAVRPGVVYTRDGRARLGVLPGKYTVYATRGFEYGLDTKKAGLGAGDTRKVRLQIRREAPTSGYVSSDTHVHTFTYSGHGDATVEERMLTLAGEGIELPIATDHDCLVDYSPVVKRLGVEDFFTPVMGCEVTTPTGHFNIFPVLAGSQLPDNRIQDWPRLMQTIRSTPGVQVVVLNHPRNIHSNFQPFAATNFNAVTGENRRGAEFSFDAVELVNSSALQSDTGLAFRDWFALLNYGYRVTGVGSSDVHDVSRYIVGQGRSYVACADEKPGRINVDEACQSLLKGRVLVSLGLLTDMTVEDKFHVGDLATGLGEKMRVAVKVLGPSWTSADRVELFSNGLKLREETIDTRRGTHGAGKHPIEKARFVWEIPRPRHDIYLVVIASGPPVTGPFWPISKPYQPSSRIWNPRVIAATNPIWIDGDGDGKYTAPRTYATALIKRSGLDPTKLLAALETYDQAVATQAASLCHAAGQDLRSTKFLEALKAAPKSVQAGFDSFANSLLASTR
jgi:hypothetical protein